MKKVPHWLLSSGIVLVGSLTLGVGLANSKRVAAFTQTKGFQVSFSQVVVHADDVSTASASSSTATSSNASAATNGTQTSASSNAISSSASLANSSSASSTSSAQSSATSSASSSSTSHSSARPVHHYDKVTSKKQLNYDVNLKRGAHKAYQGGPKNTNHKNIHANHVIKGSRMKTVHISAEATVKGVKWYKADGHWIKGSAIDTKTHYLRVPVIGQRPQLPTGCEITAVTMMLKYKGAKVNKMMLANKMPRSSNPNKGFVGNPKSPAGQLIYPGGLMNLVKHYAGSAKNMTGASMAKIKQQVQNGKPVVIWVANMDNFPNHALTVYGYNHDVIYYNDPWIDKRAKMSTANLQVHRRNDALRAISY